jgi:hypothetical protein
MSEVKRTDSMNIDHIIKYLEQNGVKSDKEVLSSAPATKIVGINELDMANMPIILDNNLRFSDKPKKSKFRQELNSIHDIVKKF